MIPNYKDRNFSLQEIIHSPIEDFPKELVPLAMYRMAAMQRLRDAACAYFKKEVPIIITSGYRSFAYNKEIGGSENSLHIWRFSPDGTFVCANDYYSPDVPLSAFFAFVARYVRGETYLHSKKNFIHEGTGAGLIDEEWVI
jgi:uncharacterized protein YcbK (DUF882 family)